MQFQCNSCGAYGTRRCNGDNSICAECGTPDNFREVEPNEQLDDFFQTNKNPYNDCKGMHRFGDKLGEKV